MSFKYNTGLVLSGGGVRGFAHLGMLKAMEEYELKPDIISGVSAGAIVAVFYADGFSSEEIFEILSEQKIFGLIGFNIPRHGLFRFAGLESVLLKNLRSRTFKGLKIPIITCATDISHGKLKYFSEGKLIRTILASSCIPILFTPVEIDGLQYVDGSLMNNLPVEPLENKCSKIIASYVDTMDGETNKLMSIFHIADSLLAIGGQFRSAINQKKADILISPAKMMKYGLHDLDKAREIFDKGYNEALKVLKKNF